MVIPVSTAAHDPTLVVGIYNTCDQWCMYCHATAWCLAYRYTASTPADPGDIDRGVTSRLARGVRLLRRLWEAEGRDPAGMSAHLSSSSALRMTFDVADDALVTSGEEYLVLSSAYLRSRPDLPFEMKRRASGPTPLEIVAWYHVLVPAKLYRALVGSVSAAAGDTALRNDSLASAKVALIGMDRSLAALAVLAAEDEDPALVPLQAHLRRLRDDVERRFPGARAFVRPGLDSVA
jgi:hypothetical protein